MLDLLYSVLIGPLRDMGSAPAFLVEVIIGGLAAGLTDNVPAAIRDRASFTVDAVKEREEVTDHDVAAFVDVVSGSVGEAQPSVTRASRPMRPAQWSDIAMARLGSSSVPSRDTAAARLRRVGVTRVNAGF